MGLPLFLMDFSSIASDSEFPVARYAPTVASFDVSGWSG
jgi:hypothetical protein